MRGARESMQSNQGRFTGFFTLLFGAALLVLVTAAPVRAQGPYVGIQGGGLYVDEAQSSDDLGKFNLDYKIGYLASATLGYDLADRFPEIGKGRMELEGAYRKVDLDKAHFADGKIGADGKLKVRSILFNTFAEYRETVPWIPYVGFGLGYAEVRLENATVSGTPLADDKDHVFAYQFGAGVGFLLGDHLTLDLGYRFFGTTNPKFKMADGSKMKTEYYSHAALLGLRLTF